MKNPTSPRHRGGITFEVTACAVLLLLMFALTIGGSCGKQGDSSSSNASDSNSSSSGATSTATASAEAGNAETGKNIFMTTCIACHTETGAARPNLGKDIASSAWVKDQTDEQLVAFIKNGRDLSDPLNTTGVAMPPKGGNPAISDAQILDLVAFIHELQKNAG